MTTLLIEPFTKMADTISIPVLYSCRLAQVASSVCLRNNNVLTQRRDSS